MAFKLGGMIDRVSERVARVDEQQGRYETRSDATTPKTVAPAPMPGRGGMLSRVIQKAIQTTIPAEQAALEVQRPTTLYDTPVRDIYSNVKADLSKPQEVQHTGQMFDPTKTFAYSGGFGSLFQ